MYLHVYIIYIYFTRKKVDIHYIQFYYSSDTYPWTRAHQRGANEFYPFTKIVDIFVILSCNNLKFPHRKLFQYEKLNLVHDQLSEIIDAYR